MSGLPLGGVTPGGGTVGQVDPGDVTLVVPTVGRDSLTATLRSLVRCGAGAAAAIHLVDDRRGGGAPLVDRAPPELLGRVRVLSGRGAGPAAARELGRRAATTPWVAFLDDDVVCPDGWWAALLADLGRCGPEVAASVGRIDVPLPADRRPTDWERNVAGLATARWATADMAYRAAALASVGGFDDRFPRAYREDADLALRVLDAGWTIAEGERRVLHPVRPAPWHVSIAKQAGNADDALMGRLHGVDWRARAGAPRGAFRHHVATTTALAVGLGAAALGRRRTAGLALGGAALGGWALATGTFAGRRIAPGPRTPTEVAAMVATSVAVPPAAVLHRLRGEWRWRRTGPSERRRARRRDPQGAVAAVLFDRDGTLVVDVPYNGDPDRVRLVPGAAEAVARLRAAGVAVGLVSNQSGVGRGVLTRAQVHAVNRRVADLLGGLDTVQVCPHAPGAGCRCRKPAPGLVLAAAAELGVDPAACAVIGDIAADVGAARAAGARGVLVPAAATRPGEVVAAAEVAVDLAEAVDRLLASGAGAVHPAAGATPGGTAGPADGARRPVRHLVAVTP